MYLVVDYFMKSCTFLKITTVWKSSFIRETYVIIKYIPLSVTLKTFEVSFSSSNSSCKVLYSCILFAREILQILMKLSWEQLARRRSPPSVKKKESLESSDEEVLRDCAYTVFNYNVFILSCFKVLKKIMQE